MIQLNAEEFHQAAQGHSMLLVLFVGADAASIESATSRLERLTGEPGKTPWHLAYVRVDRNIELAKMFAVADDLPVLLIMRDEVVLFCEPVGRLSDSRLADLIARAGKLDMHEIRQEIAEERRNRVALFEKRVCPTARRLR